MNENLKGYELCIKIALDNAKKRITILDNYEKKSVLKLILCLYKLQVMGG